MADQQGRAVVAATVLPITARVVANLITSFTDWVWIGVGALVLIGIAGVLVMVNQWLARRSDGGRIGVMLTATGDSQIRNSKLETSGTGSLDITAVEIRRSINPTSRRPTKTSGSAPRAEAKNPGPRPRHTTERPTPFVARGGA